jgi:glutamate-5-semialdehyde dehydrogenase
MSEAINELEIKGKIAKSAARRLAYLPTGIKNNALKNIAQGLLDNKEEILRANELDCREAAISGMNTAMLDRLVLTEERIQSMAADVMSIVDLSDPIGEFIEMRTLPNGLLLGKKRVPIGVIAAIYESRPNVTIDISCLCLKSGNAIILRGGKETISSNRVLVRLASEAIERAGVPSGAIQLIENTDHALVSHLLKMRDIIDLVIPRGGAELINFVRDNATMPVVAGGIGVCHAYVDKIADIAKAVAIIYNAKVQRPTVCNALDTILVHRNIAASYLPGIAEALAQAGVEMHCDPDSLDILKKMTGIKLLAAIDEDWGKEFLALIAAIKVVNSLDEALEHITTHGSGHSELIITEDYSAAMRFLNEVDAACVYVNASTRFTDGAQFGMGAEVGISTQKMHARGPLGLKEITSYKWIIFGNGQVRP